MGLIFTLTKTTVASDLSQQIFSDDCFVCFYDSNRRLAPDSLDVYISAPHALVKSDESPPCEIEASLMELEGAPNCFSCTRLDLSSLPHL